MRGNLLRERDLFFMDIKIYQNSLTIIYRNLIREDIAVGTNAVKITRRSLKFEIVMEV